MADLGALTDTLREYRDDGGSCLLLGLSGTRALWQHRSLDEMARNFGCTGKKLQLAWEECKDPVKRSTAFADVTAQRLEQPDWDYAQYLLKIMQKKYVNLVILTDPHRYLFDLINSCNINVNYRAGWELNNHQLDAMIKESRAGAPLILDMGDLLTQLWPNSHYPDWNKTYHLATLKAAISCYNCFLSWGWDPEWNTDLGTLLDCDVAVAPGKRRRLWNAGLSAFGFGRFQETYTVDILDNPRPDGQIFEDLAESLGVSGSADEAETSAAPRAYNGRAGLQAGGSYGPAEALIPFRADLLRELVPSDDDARPKIIAISGGASRAALIAPFIVRRLAERLNADKEDIALVISPDPTQLAILAEEAIDQDTIGVVALLADDPQKLVDVHAKDQSELARHRDDFGAALDGAIIHLGNLDLSSTGANLVLLVSSMAHHWILRGKAGKDFTERWRLSQLLANEVLTPENLRGWLRSLPLGRWLVRQDERVADRLLDRLSAGIIVAVEGMVAAKGVRIPGKFHAVDLDSIRMGYACDLCQQIALALQAVEVDGRDVERSAALIECEALEVIARGAPEPDKREDIIFVRPIDPVPYRQDDRPDDEGIHDMEDDGDDDDDDEDDIDLDFRPIP